MKKRLPVIGVVAIAVAVLMQVVRPEQSNPRIDPAQTIEAQMHVPADVAGILHRACRDCHTDATVWKWYGNIAPVSWLMVWDVNSGRKKMDLSQWTKLSKGQQEDRLKGICDEVTSGGMPLWYYRPLHSEARLSDADKQKLCDWTKVALAGKASRYSETILVADVAHAPGVPRSQSCERVIGPDK